MALRDDLVQYYRWLRDYGYNDSHSGNASVREGDVIWITPTGAFAELLKPHDLIACRLDGEIPQGASLDAALHLGVYRANPQVNAVLHSHGAYTVGATLDGADYLPPDFEGRHYFERVPVLDIAYSDYWREAPRRVPDALRTSPIVVVRGHGVYAVGETLERAYKWTCSLELSARTAVIARQAGTL
jgi:L-fuculose-phosphate aldolase